MLAALAHQICSPNGNGRMRTVSRPTVPPTRLLIKEYQNNPPLIFRHFCVPFAPLRSRSLLSLSLSLFPSLATKKIDDDQLDPSEKDLDPPLGVAINKYSLWVAGAVNMGIIKIEDLTDLAATSFAAAYEGLLEDDAAGGGEEEEEDDDGETVVTLPTGVVCTSPAFYGDGWCDKPNNENACNWDGGDCCEDTCVDGLTEW